MGGSNDGHTLTSGTFGTVPRRGGVSSPRGPYGSDIGGTLLAFGAFGASIDPLKFNIDKSGLRVFLAEG